MCDRMAEVMRYKSVQTERFSFFLRLLAALVWKG